MGGGKRTVCFSKREMFYVPGRKITARRFYFTMRISEPAVQNAVHSTFKMTGVSTTYRSCSTFIPFTQRLG